ncbi:hypothetical protein LTR15_004954 [Elasticomyces elasticus]|nr:hypothetical protein LTR15_004954 [Elasticomyces elasticus]
MAFQPLSVGDILMLSQQAWKIGRAFKQGQTSAPSEFLEVEREADGLSEALKLVAETLHEDGAMLAAADGDTQSAVKTILESAHKTLSDLESFVERYQVIKKKETKGGFVVERSWSEVVVANYKTFKWTTEGGDITNLRNILMMHTNTINLVMQALQSRSLARLEKTVMPMAENIADIHQIVNGDLSTKIDDLHRIIMSVANATPSLQARDRAIEEGGSSRSNSISTVSTFETASANGTVARALEPPPPRVVPYNIQTRQLLDRRSSAQSSHSSKSTMVAARQARKEDSAYYSMGPDTRHVDWNFEAGSPPDHRESIGNGIASGSSPSPNSLSVRHPSTIARRESSTLPYLFSAISEPDTLPGGEDPYHADVSPTGRTPATTSSKASSSRNPRHAPVLPPPALPPGGDGGSMFAATPSSTLFGSPTRQRNGTVSSRNMSRPQTARQSKHNSIDSLGSTKAFEAPSFEKLLFRNAAILCDVRGTLVEYAQKRPDEPDPRFETEMREACQVSRICVIRKRENREHGGTKVVTSIWTLADGVRLQQKLSDINETVPYCSYFDPLKVSLPPSEGPTSEISLKFHPSTFGAALEDEKKTNWINYVFASDNDANAFQSAVFGRTLLGSYRTTKTTVLHEGVRGVFAFEEQFANIEILRLWEDDGISTPGAAGGVLALLHVSSNFGEGYARWWVNSSRQHVRVKEDGAKWARVKGIDVVVFKPGTGADNARSPVFATEGLQRVDTFAEGRPTGGKRIPVRAVTGVKVEFAADDEKTKFINKCRRVQEKMLPLPDL